MFGQGGTSRISGEHFQELFSRHYRALCLLAMKVVSSREEAEDIVHDLFLSAWERRATFREPEHVKAYLFRAVYHKSINARARSRRADVPPPEGRDEDNYLRLRIEAEVHHEVMQALEQLPERCRETFLLSYVEELTVAEVAARLGVSEATVKTQRAKAKHLLQEILKDLFLGL